jgi:Ca2+-binding RTX toxin-like protein
MSGRPRRLSIDTLEGRTVPANQLTATLDLADHVLRIEGTDGNDGILLDHQAGRLSVDGITITVIDAGTETQEESVPDAQVSAVVINALDGTDNISVQGLAAGTALTMNAGPGSDVTGFFEDSNDRPISFDGGTGHSDYLYIYDIRSGPNSYTVTDTAVAGPGLHVPYASTTNLFVFSVNGTADTYDVQSVGPTTHVHLWGYGGDDVYRVGGPAGLNDIHGGVFVSGMDGADTVTVDNTGGWAVSEFEVGAGRTLLGGRGFVDYAAGVEGVTLRGGEFEERFTVVNTTPAVPISLDGGGGSNTLRYEAAAGLSAWYPGEGNAVDGAYDNTGTPVGATTFAPGRIGQAFQFEGWENPGHVRVPNFAPLESETVTVEAWVNSTSVPAPGEYRYIVAKGAAGFSGASYALVTSNAGGLWFYVGNGHAFQYSPDPGTGVWDGNWHHVVGTYDGNYVRLYVDGVEVGNGTLLTDALGYGLPDTNDLFIGTYNGIPGYTFNGRIDEPSVYDRALTAAEVQALFANGKTGLGASDVTVNLTTGTATGLAGVSNIRNVTGGVGNDSLTGDMFTNILTGRAGNDTLFGLDSGDLLDGGSGNDTLNGGLAPDLYAFGPAGAPETDAVVETQGGAGDNLLFSRLLATDPVAVDLSSPTLAQHTNRTVVVGPGGAASRIENATGGAGNDTIRGNASPNVLEGGEGHDSVSGLYGADTLYGDVGNDTLTGGDGYDQLHGWDGDDRLDGSAGNDSAYGGTGNDWITGEAGADLVDGWEGNDTLFGYIGNDTIYGGDGSDELHGWDGHDQLFAGPGPDFLYGAAGNDVMNGAEGVDFLDGGAGNDTMDGFSGFDRLYGGDGADNLSGGDDGDQVFGNAGNDSVYGGDGNDELNGGEGNDLVDGWTGRDTLYGYIGNDIMFGGTGNDELHGWDGQDQLNGNADNDTLYGAASNDTLNGGEGNDRVDGSDGNDVLYGFDGNDTLYGGNGNDELNGWFGDDYLYGWEGNDTLFGGDGNDTLDGEGGRDAAHGGDGYDVTWIGQPGDTSTGCENVTIQNVPGGAPQTDGWSCGPNSASRVLRWYGINKTYEDLRAETEEEGDLISQLHLGTRPSTLLELMRKYRPQTQMATRENVPNDQAQGLEQLFAQVSAGKPVIVLNHRDYPSYLEFGPGGFVPNTLHWFVVTGFDRATQRITVRETNGTEVTFTFDQFWQMWNWRSGGLAGDALTGSLGTKPRTMLY